MLLVAYNNGYSPASYGEKTTKHPGVVIFPSIIHFPDGKPFVRLVCVISRTKRQLLVSPFHRFAARRNALMSIYAGAFSRIHIRLESIMSVYLGTQKSVIEVVLKSQDKPKDTKKVSHFVAYIRSQHAQNERQGRACGPKNAKNSRKWPELARADLVEHRYRCLVLVFLETCVDEVAQVYGELLLRRPAGRDLRGRHGLFREIFSCVCFPRMCGVD